MSGDLQIRRCHQELCLEVDGETVAHSSRALALHECGHPVRFYFPLEDVCREALRESARQTVCLRKGRARYYDVITAQGEHQDLAWHYRDPIPKAAALSEHVAFYHERATLIIGPTKPGVTTPPREITPWLEWLE